MKKISLLFILFIVLLFLTACGKTVHVEDLSDKDIYSCKKDSDCAHVKGCHEDGGSACVNKKYAKVLGDEGKDCDEEDCKPCSTCSCDEGRCKNIIDMKNYCC